MWKYISILFVGISVSFYCFPFEFSFMRGINTKMGLALFGIVVVVYNLIRKRDVNIAPDFFRILLVAMFVSLVGLASVVINNTTDIAYATYFISMLVWLSAAYAVCSLIKKIHGELTIEIITVYLTFVCVFQCVSALIIDSNIAIKNIVDTYVMQDQVKLTEIERLYGIGASLDTAGVRFSACLILLVHVLNKKKSSLANIQLFFAIISYVLIAVVGNMMARTTIVGVALSLLYAAITFRPTSISYGFVRLTRITLVIVVFAVPLCVYLYDHSLQFHGLIRFAFEGFFNLFEEGEWQTDSGDRLKTMIVFPDNAKTWIIGDGYFINPYNTNPYYVGYQPSGGFYMGTDIGYCRFLFYFGIIGLLAFSFFFVVVAKECIKLLPSYKVLILFILLLGFVIWLKVATDVFLVFALLLCVGNMQNDTSASLEYQS